MSSTEITPASIRFAAMNLLAMREHSGYELQQKLAKKFQQTDWIPEVIACLKADGLQSDERFAEAFANMRKRQGKGPLLISAELKAKGVAAGLVAEVLAAGDADWLLLAKELRIKKFGADIPMDLKIRAKQARYLALRGFSAAAIKHAFSDSEE